MTLPDIAGGDFDEPANYADLERAVLNARVKVQLLGSKGTVDASTDLTTKMRDLLTFNSDGKRVEHLQAVQRAYADERTSYLTKCRRDLKPWKVWR